MLLSRMLKLKSPHLFKGCTYNVSRLSSRFRTASTKPLVNPEEAGVEVVSGNDPPQSTGFNVERALRPARALPMLMTKKEPVVLSFDSVPGPKSLKLFSNVRHYISEIGTQVTAAALTTALNVGTILKKRQSLKRFSTLFDEYGPVVRFVSPVGGDVVLITNPEHIQKVYDVEGDYPVRSSLDSLEKYRKEHRNHLYCGLFNSHGKEWNRHKNVVMEPFYQSVTDHMNGLLDISDMFTDKVYHLRNHHDEVSKDIYKEVHKWSFDTIGLIMFSKRFNILESDIVNSQCDDSWLYHSFTKATAAILRCEKGLHLWKLFTTPAWRSLVSYCDSLDSIIGKYVLESEQFIVEGSKSELISPKDNQSLIISMLMSEEKLTPEDISTVLMDMLFIGVNTVASSMSFLMFLLAKHQACQKLLFQEIDDVYSQQNITVDQVMKLKEDTPYLQACIKETLRLMPPIPVLTRILPKNIILDRYNIPRGTMIMMSTMESSLRESNYDNADRFQPERWLRHDAKAYNGFASIPFGYGARKCLGQNIAETMMAVLTLKIVQKFKLEYHYGDIEPTRTFITRPNRALRIRFMDRV